MLNGTDLYSILVFYADKINSPFITVTSLLEFLENLSKKQSGDNSIWYSWVKDRAMKFWSEISNLTGAGKCELITRGEVNQIYMPYFYEELLDKAYQETDKSADQPFFSEESLRITVPENEILTLASEYELLSLLEGTDSTAKILEIIFPGDFGSAVVLTDMIPERLSGIALNKIKNYLMRYGNKEYALNKLTTQLQGREVYLREVLDKLADQPLDLYPDIEAGGETFYIFWSHFSAFVKSEIEKKREHLPMDIAAYQASYIIDVVTRYFKALAAKLRESDTAFKALENHLSKAPFIYTMDEILKFNNSKGEPLLGKYTHGELEAWLRQKTTESADGRLPQIVVMPGAAKNDQYFISKEKIPSLCTRYLSDARLKVNDAVTKHWTRLITEYEKEPAMENNSDFEKLLLKYLERLSHDLMEMIANPKVALIYQEMEQDGNVVPFSVRIFEHGRLLPYSTFLNISRKDLLRDIKLSLPFWYSFSILRGLVNFFKKFGKKKSNTRDEENDEPEVQQERAHSGDLRSAARELEASIIPQGYSLEDYLEKLQERWSKIIDPKARKNLIDDVNNLVRDYMRRTLKIQKQFRPSRETLNQMATELVRRNQALSTLSDRDSLIVYLELQMVKFMENYR
ncbi:MAG: hypothetical protein LBQ94_06320 [Treponema sp.]|jgi:hypothetical protein|nr:hypothetical protein [Treponema sp.]